MPIIIRGVNETIRMIDRHMNQKHRDIVKEATRIQEDLLRQARNRAPFREGTLVDSMTGRTTDLGRGNGARIEVSAGDTPYARRMHESVYQARPRSDMVRRISKRTGKAYWAYRRSMKIRGTSTRRIGGIKISADYRLHQGGFWIDGRGNKHGRKYLQRALDENIQRYNARLARFGDRTTT